MSNVERKCLLHIARLLFKIITKQCVEADELYELEDILYDLETTI